MKIGWVLKRLLDRYVNIWTTFHLNYLCVSSSVSFAGETNGALRKNRVSDEMVWKTIALNAISTQL